MLVKQTLFVAHSVAMGGCQNPAVCFSIRKPTRLGN